MDWQFYSLGTILERSVRDVLPWPGLPKIAEAIAEENNQ